MQRFGRFNRPGLKGSANYSLLGGASGCSDPAPVDPTSVAATPDSPAIGVAVSWTASSTAQYNVYRNTTNSTTGATLVGSSSGSGGMSYVDNSANSGSNRPLASTTYFYWVQGVTCGGTSALIPASQNSTGGVTTAAITYTTYLPNNANLTVSDYVNIAEQSTTRLRFSRPAGDNNAFIGCAPNTRVSFTTDATYLRLNLAYANNPGGSNRLATGAILVNGVEYGTFLYSGSLPGSGQHDFTLPGGSNVVTVLWPSSADTDLTSVLLDSGASLAAAPARPTNRIVFAGDSITQGFSVTKPTLAWTELTAVNQSRQAFNVAYGAAPASVYDATAMLATVSNADLGVYMVGTNDLFNQYPLSQYDTHLRGWIRKAKSLMTTPRLFIASPIFNGGTWTITLAQYRAQAQSTVQALMTYGNGDERLFYLNGADLMPSNASGLADGVHPNNTGANEIYTNVTAAMNATAPIAPSGLTATSISSSQIDLSWTDNASTEIGFAVQRRFPATTGSWEQVGVTLAGTTTFSDTGLAASSQYEYRVCAYNGGGSSAFTAETKATTSAGTASRIRVLVVAGGGGGGGCGGGGGGGVRHDTAFVASPGTTYTVTVGAGGAGGAGNAQGGNGTDSSFGVVGNIITGTGGGGGGGFSNTNQNGRDGGSGGGAGAMASPPYTTGTGGNGNTPVTSPSQGNNGGTSQTFNAFGGGGGAASNGQAAMAGNAGGGGSGGDGLLNNIQGLYSTYGGGGGGGSGRQYGIGGRGGGGDGRAFGLRASFAGTVNTGGGGGGGYNDTGKAGGSGIVVLRMPTSEYTGVTTGSPAVTTAGNDTVLTFTSSGSYKA